MLRETCEVAVMPATPKRLSVAQARQVVSALVVLWDDPSETFSIRALAYAASQVLTAICENDSAHQELRDEILALLACLAAYGDAK
jgi:hypothetical protein